MFDAYKAARDAVEARIGSDYNTTLATVCSEHGSTARNARAIYRVTQPRSLTFPCHVIGQARGVIDDASSRSIVSVVSVPVMIATDGSDPARVDAEMDDHITATVRLFAGYETPALRFSVEDFDADQPSPYENANLLQTAVVNVTVLVKESR
jgi:hypothetical protein